MFLARAQKKNAQSAGQIAQREGKKLDTDPD